MPITDVDTLKKIYLSADKLTMHLKDNINEAITSTIVGNCSKDEGFYLCINKITKITPNPMDSASNISFNVNLNIRCLLPCVGEEFTGNITKIFPIGIYVNVSNMEIMIPAKNILAFEYDPTLQNFTSSSSDFSKMYKPALKIGILICVTISAIRYTNKKYSCIGIFKDFK